MRKSDCIILAFSLAVFVGLLMPLRTAFTDDGFIHMQYARNIATRGEYSFNAGYVSFGTTSPLWVMLLAASTYVVGGGEHMVMTSHVLAWLGGLLTVTFIWLLCRRLGLSSWTTAACTALSASHVWLVRWTALSMESSLASAAVACAGLAALSADRNERAAVWTGFFMAIAALVRPEAYLLLIVYVISVLWTKRRSGLGIVTRAVGVYAALVVPWLLFARIHIGHFFPITASAKSGGVLFYPLLPMMSVVGAAEALPILATVVGAYMLRRRFCVWTPRYRFMLLWVIALPTAYALMDVQVISRYMLIITPFIMVIGFSAFEDLRSKMGSRVWRSTLVTLTALAMAGNMAVYFTKVVPPSRAFAEDLTHHLKRLAVALGEDASTHVDGKSVVAAADIGYLGFYSGQHILDLGGLVDDVTARLRTQYSYDEIVDRGLYLTLKEYPRVDYFVDRALTRDRFTGRTLKGYHFEKIHEETVRNLGIKKPGPYHYTLYRLRKEG